jgi:hypothetical protein
VTQDEGSLTVGYAELTATPEQVLTQLKELQIPGASNAKSLDDFCWWPVGVYRLVRYTFRASFGKLYLDFAKFPKGVYPLGTLEISNTNEADLDTVLAGLSEGLPTRSKIVELLWESRKEDLYALLTTKGYVLPLEYHSPRLTDTQIYAQTREAFEEMLVPMSPPSFSDDSSDDDDERDEAATEALAVPPADNQNY